MNPIENVWGWMSKQLYEANFRATNADILWDEIEKLWDCIPETLTTNLIASVPNRLKSVIELHGSWTKY